MRKIEKYINYIKTVLINKNIDNEITDWKSHQNLLELSNTTSEIYFTDSVKLGMDANELIYLIKINSDTVNDTVVSNIKNEIEERTKEIVDQLQAESSKEIFKSINLLFFVSSIHSRVTLKDAFSSKNALELIKKLRKITSTRNAKLYPMFYLDKDISTDEIKLPNIRRYEMVTLPPFDIDIDIPKDNASCTLKGYVFTANLFDLVSLYNTIGDQLFKKNVRLGIEDKLDVDKSIKETLTDKPEAFWFRNNGVTILVEESHMKLDRVGEIILKEADKSELKFSVINGAQTITAASEYYYALSSKERDKQASVAKVIVKIIHIRDDNPQRAEKEAKTISVALNRQKPIKSEDIAFTNEFVETMNDYLEASQAPYILVRRGEEFSSSSKAYSLINFAKARKACAGDPGAARSNATSTLLKINPETSRFGDQEIFKSEWYSANETERRNLFKTFYSPVSFATDMAADCQSISKKVQRTDAAGNVMKNGMWYFIAYTVYILNDGDDQDYSHFTYSAEKIRSEEFRKLFEEFAEFYCENLNADITTTNSNAFKTSENYKKLKASNYIGSTFYQSVCKLLGKKMDISYDEIMKNTSSRFNDISFADENDIQVIYNGISHIVSNVTEAFVYTVQQCLENASTEHYTTAMETLAFLTRNDAISTGSFRSKTPVTVKHETIYIGKNSSSEDKLKQIIKLCDLLRIKPQTILWRKENSIIFEY